MSEKEVNRPTAPHMDTRLSAVVQDVLVLAPSILKGISKDWETIKGTLGVDAFGERENGGGEPGGIEGDGAEGVAYDAMEESCMGCLRLHNVVTGSCSPLFNSLSNLRGIEGEARCHSCGVAMAVKRLIFSHPCNSDGCSVGSLALPFPRRTICESLGNFDRFSTAFIGEQVPNVSAASNSEQAQLPLAGFAT